MKTYEEIKNKIESGIKVDLADLLIKDEVTLDQFTELSSLQESVKLELNGGGSARVEKLFKVESLTWAEDYEDAIKKMPQRPYETGHGAYEGAAVQVYNYATALITNVGSTTNEMDPASSIGINADSLLADGIAKVPDGSDLDKRVRFLKEIKKAYAVKSVPGSKVASQELLPAMESTTKSGFKKHTLRKLEEVRKIMRAVMYKCDWTDCAEMSAVSKVMEAAKRFYQENGIDGTKKLPPNGLDIPFEKRLKYIKKLSKVPYRNFFDWEVGTFKSLLWKNNEPFDLEKNRVELKRRMIAPFKFEQVVDEDGNPVFKGYVEDLASPARAAIADYAMEEVQKKVDALMDVFMDEGVIKAAKTAYDECSRNFKAFVSYIRRANNDLTGHFIALQEEALARADYDVNDAMYQATLKSLKAQKSAAKRDLKNTLRTGYRFAHIAPSKIGTIMLGAVLSEKTEYEDIKSDFARLLDQEWALAAIQLSKVAGYPVDDKVVAEIDGCIVPEGMEIEVNDEGLCLVGNEIVGEVSDLNPGKYTVEESNGTFYATASLVDILIADINAIEAGPAQGIMFQLKFGAEVSTTSLLQEMIGEEVVLLHKPENKFVDRVFTKEGKPVAKYFSELSVKNEKTGRNENKTNEILVGLTQDLNGVISNGIVAIVKRTGADGELVDRYSIFLTVKGTQGGVSAEFKMNALETLGLNKEEEFDPDAFIKKMFVMK